MTRALIGAALLLAAGCSEAPMQPTPAIATVVCADCRTVYVTVYGVVTVGQPAQPIKARVVVDGVEHHTDASGTVSLVVTPTTVLRRVEISAWGFVSQVWFPEPPYHDLFLVLK